MQLELRKEGIISRPDRVYKLGFQENCLAARHPLLETLSTATTVVVDEIAGFLSAPCLLNLSIKLGLRPRHLIEAPQSELF